MPRADRKRAGFSEALVSPERALSFIKDGHDEKRVAELIQLAAMVQVLRNLAMEALAGLEWFLEARKAIRRIPVPPSWMARAMGEQPPVKNKGGAQGERAFRRSLLAALRMSAATRALRELATAAKELEAMIASPPILRLLRRLRRSAELDGIALMLWIFDVQRERRDPVRATDLAALSVAVGLEAPTDDPYQRLNSWAKRLRKAKARIDVGALRRRMPASAMDFDPFDEIATAKEAMEFVSDLGPLLRPRPAEASQDLTPRQAAADPGSGK